ncbi:NAC domain-containing protein 82-like isoform X1 [Salvia splendens]|uniref:NAC domain-containing protein 82-like isoform X1 n=2 Tax=Salvia splendens TaxID=180675 RepID=UPI001C25E204|nr:NAC domain-containing protein 82-like isoform X1 [Salvia splendens]XP_042021121.1 NAC domain-containing protein 82-like isoform X1 [Salvia splendens]XP_042021122.1 NAC domain-containing protein 82-like isoform X1 [Salvia splendens]XP_042021123.1 NAC domain-containing protein 82-like isoform X1 [Salvia splendens]
MRQRLGPGFRFHPTDVELVLYYLKRKILGKKLLCEPIAEVNIYKYSPWDLPDKSCLKTKDLEWFFFCPREKKYASGARVKRATKDGFWKTTGKGRPISHNGRIVGAVNTLIFHQGHAPHGRRTDWVMHEYKLIDNELAAAGVQDNYVVCKVFEKNGPGPKNGAQYGAPFNPADWTDDDDDVAENHSIPQAAEAPSQTAWMQNEEHSLPLGSGLLDSGNGPLPMLEEGPSSSVVAPTSIVAADETNDEIDSMLACFVDEDMLLPDGNGFNQDDLSGNGNNRLLPCSGGLDIYNHLHDLDGWRKINEGRYDFSGSQNVDYPLYMLPVDNSTYIELDDLRLPLDCSNGVTGAHFSSSGLGSASYGHENIHQLNSITGFAGIGDQHLSFANELSVLPNTSGGDISLDVLQMVDNPFYQVTNDSHNSDFSFGQLGNPVCSPPNTERGLHLEYHYSRFMERIPAHLPTVAKILALCSCGGSSIHIKAEVTHRAGECTNEALAVMMGGSSSCWFFCKLQLCALESLLEFA